MFAASLMIVAGVFILPSADYRIDPPDVHRIDVVGLPKKAKSVAGNHPVRPDGTISLGDYGSVAVAGKTVEQVRATVVDKLVGDGKKKRKLEVRVEVAAFNSKFYYVITDFAGNGEQVVKFPITGDTTVLDAVANLGGLAVVASKSIWIARPSLGAERPRILTVDGSAIRDGVTVTNYQILPGDRVFVMSRQAK